MNRGPYASEQAAWSVAGQMNRRLRRRGEGRAYTVLPEGDKFVVTDIEPPRPCDQRLMVDP